MASDVSQRAREAYIAFAASTSRLRADLYGDAIRAGEWDDTDDLKFFARFEAEIRADEREQIQIWLNACSGSFRATTVAAAIAALEHKDAIRKGPTP